MEPSNFLDNFDFIAPYNEIDHEPVKKKKSSKMEQKGRHKINEQINELKYLLPETRYVSTTKASVLECAVNSLRKLQAAREQLEAANQKLQSENKNLREEIDSSENDESECSDANESPSETKDDKQEITEIVQSIPKEENENIQEIDFLTPYGSQSLFGTNSNPVNGSSDQLFMNYQNSPPFHFSMSSPLNSLSFNLSGSNESFSSILRKHPSSPLTSNSSMQQMLSTSSNNATQAKRSRNLEDGDDSKVSKRRLLLIILVLIPLFCCFDPPSNSTRPSSGRVLLEFATEPRNIFITVFYILDVARFLVYCALGVLGAKWTTDSFLWLTRTEQLSSFESALKSKV